MRKLIPTFCLNLLFAIVLAPGVVQAQVSNSPTRLSETLLTERHPYLQQGNLSDEQATLQALYQARNFEPLWFSQNQPTRQALALLGVLRDAARYGLRATDYDGTTLTYRLAALADLPLQPASQARMQLELGLSVAALRFIRHVHYGRIDPRKVGFNLGHSRSAELDAPAALTLLATTDDATAAITRLEPQFGHYQLLKAALARYRLLAIDSELTQLPVFTGRSIKPGEPYAGAPALRRLLRAEQDLSDNEALPDSDTSLDPALTEALKNYQTRHGLQADGALGKQTFAALTTPFTQRVQQIELTLERWRWLPPLQSPMIVVNVPQFKLFAFKENNDREANLLRMDVIVGQAFPHTQTPIFLADLKYMVFRPYWDVPFNIMQREMLASIQKDPGYLARNDMELVRGQGDNSPVVSATLENIAALNSGAVRVRQKPGNHNALGEVKFMFPNEHNVYLHSTPAKQLFSQSRRAFSHGCIRVSDPVALAEYVLRNASSEWSTEQIKAAMSGEPNQRINLQQSIPVLIVYGTVMPLESGVVQFFDDIYGHDRKLAALLDSRVR